MQKHYPYLPFLNVCPREINLTWKLKLIMDRCLVWPKAFILFWLDDYTKFNQFRWLKKDGEKNNNNNKKKPEKYKGRWQCLIFALAFEILFVYRISHITSIRWRSNWKNLIVQCSITAVHAIVQQVILKGCYF